MKKSYIYPVLGFATILSISTAQAATVSWGAATGVTASTDISTSGTLVVAENMGGGGAVTVNGVNFTGGTSFGGNNTGTGSVPEFNGVGITDASLITLLDDAAWNGGGAQTITIGGLTAETQYEIQIFHADVRGCCNGRTGTVAAGDGSGAVSTGLTGSPSSVIGTFTTGVGDTEVTFQSFNNADTGQFLNAYQIRQIPEPSAALLSLLGMTVLLRRRR